MADLPPATLGVAQVLSPSEQQQVLDLVTRAARADGHRAVNEAGLLALRHQQTSASGSSADPGSDTAQAGSPGPIHVLARDPLTSAVVGYGQALWEGDGPVAALVVDPAYRRRGTGTLLWRALAAGAGQPLRIWASGNGPDARALADSLGLQPVRTLLVLGRPLSGELPPVDPPDGITIRSFRPGQDEEAWLAVNARAFASHPEQGSITRSDLEERMAEPWFDPAGLLLAVRADTAATGDAGDTGDTVLGFHWTKREPGSDTGEVYVLGVDPDAGVRGLGTPLLGAGLRHLRDGGASQVDLYVEADNERALSLYRRYGFTTLTSDVMYAHPG
ncbi:MAG TPA: mycothiol synthase [Microlunatus sp.]|nr:mycothiol synthase [Microlunatus sp.]